MLKYRARIANAENGTLLRACIETQKQGELPYEKHCSEILRKHGIEDATHYGKNSKEMKTMTEKMKTNDFQKQKERLTREVSKTTRLYQAL